MRWPPAPRAKWRLARRISGNGIIVVQFRKPLIDGRALAVGLPGTRRRPRAESTAHEQRIPNPGLPVARAGSGSKLSVTKQE